MNYLTHWPNHMGHTRWIILPVYPPTWDLWFQPICHLTWNELDERSCPFSDLIIPVFLNDFRPMGLTLTSPVWMILDTWLYRRTSQIQLAWPTDIFALVYSADSDTSNQVLEQQIWNHNDSAAGWGPLLHAHLIVVPPGDGNIWMDPIGIGWQGSCDYPNFLINGRLINFYH